MRNGRYYAILWADRGDGTKAARRFPLLDDSGVPIRALQAARDALDGVKAKRLDGALPQSGIKPAFDDFAAFYLQMQSTRAKKHGTQQNEAQAIARWKIHFGRTRIDRLATPSIKTFIESRMRGCVLAGRKYEPVSPRTAKLDLIALSNVLNAAVDAGHLRECPRLPTIKVPPAPRRHLMTPPQFEKLLAACTARKPDGEAVTKNGGQLQDYLQFLAFTGAREKEALPTKWTHVDFDNARVFIGAPPDFEATTLSIGKGGVSKNHGCRAVDFNPQLETLVTDMYSRRPQDSAFLFPSPRRGEKDIPAKSLRESLRLARGHAGLPNAGFHDLRHIFISHAVMAGIDFMTIAEWVGHKDGGILIGKVHGHLLDEHRRKMAAKLTIGAVGSNDSKMHTERTGSSPRRA